MVAKSRLVLFALLFTSRSCWAEEESFAIDHAVVNVTSCQNSAAKDRMFACHRIERGEGYVVATRRYWPARRSDDDAFEKVTVAFHSKPRAGDKLDISSERIFVSFSAGPSSFPGRHGCYGVAKDGVVEIVGVSESVISVLVSATIDLQSPLGFYGECEQKKVMKREVAGRVMRVDDLNAWRGRWDGSVDTWDEARP